jgi:hypothetical protein
MAIAIYDKFITLTESGATVPSAVLSVNNTGDAGTGLAALWQDLAATIPAANPFTADSLGRVQFYLEANKYTMQATSVSGVVDYPNVVVSAETVDADETVYNSTTVGDYLDNQNVADYTALRAGLTANNYKADDIIQELGRMGRVFKVEAIGSNTDNDGTIATGGSFAAVNDAPEVLNAVEFGCLPGVGDCAANLNALMTYARTLGSNVSVYAPGGQFTYFLGASVDMDRVSLFSDPGKAVFTAIAGIGATDYMFTALGGVSYGDSKHSFKNIEVDCASLCNGVHIAVRHWNMENFMIKNADATTANVGAWIERNTQLLDNFHILDCGIGVDLDGVTSATIAASAVQRFHISDCTIGIRCNEAQKLFIGGGSSVLQTCGTEIVFTGNAGADFDSVTISDVYFEDQTGPKTEFILLDPDSANDIEGITIENCFFYAGNIAGMVAVRSNNCEILNFNKNFIRGIPYVLALANSADTSGSYEGNVHSTNVTSIADPADTTTIAALRKFRFGKNKNFNAKVSGTDTIATATASETVTHGLDITPEKVQVTMGATTAAVATTSIALFVENITSTTFDVSRAGGAVTGNLPFTYTAWFGEM